MDTDKNVNQRQKRRRLVLGGAGIIVIIGVISLWAAHRTKAVATTGTRAPKGEQVTVASVNSLSPNNAALSVIGKVESENEATVLSETSGEITQLDHALGDHVGAGDIIAQMENSSQVAAVAQAQGSYEAAEANLTKASGTTTQNVAVSSNQAIQTADNAQVSAMAAVESAYAALDDAVHTKADTLFINPRTQEAQVLPAFIIPDSEIVVTVQMERLKLEPILAQAETLTSDADSADTDGNISLMVQYAQTTETFLNDLIKMTNEAMPNSSMTAATISGYQSTLSAARTEVVAAVTSLTTSKTTYDSDLAVSTSASNSADTGNTSDVAVAQANVQTTLGALDAAKASLAKTIIRSPISGTIIDLPVTNGDYVNSFAEVAEISNPSALKLVAYVTAADAQTLAVGNKAVVDGTVSGVITQVAPAIDPSTGTIEVDVGLTGDTSSLTDGDSVTVDLDRTSTAATASTTTAATSTQNIIPIVALKITPTGPVVFTVDAKTKTLVSHSVTIGSILGDNIVVTSGLTPGMAIVTDARGLTAGENVTVKQQ